MNTIRIIAFAFVIMLIPGTNALGNELSVTEILKKVAAKYETMQTYKAEGTLTSEHEDDMGISLYSVEYSISILMKKPDMYLITWTQKDGEFRGNWSVTVWSEGTQPYLYFGLGNNFCKMPSDKKVLSGSKRMHGPFNIIPSLFLPVFEEDKVSFSWLEDPKLEKIEKIGEEDFYVISGPTAVSKKETLWISKTSYLIKKYYRILDYLKMIELRTDISDEYRTTLREWHENENVIHTYTEVYTKISFPELSKSDFTFDLPEGTYFSGDCPQR